MRCQIKILFKRPKFIKVNFIACTLPRPVKYAFWLDSHRGNLKLVGLKTKTTRLRFFVAVRILDRLIKNGLFN